MYICLKHIHRCSIRPCIKMHVSACSFDERGPFSMWMPVLKLTPDHRGPISQRFKLRSFRLDIQCCTIWHTLVRKMSTMFPDMHLQHDTHRIHCGLSTTATKPPPYRRNSNHGLQPRALQVITQLLASHIVDSCQRSYGRSQVIYISQVISQVGKA